MTRFLSADAPCKINRELRVGRLRADGYHEIRSRMVTIDLADTLRAEESDGLELSCSDPSLPAGPENLVMRAAARLADAAGARLGAKIRLEKRVPAGGGLGGGSSDAACTLRLLTALWRLSIAEEDLVAARGRTRQRRPLFPPGGRGGSFRAGVIRSRRCADGRPTDLLLLVPPFPVSTAAVYREFAGRGALPDRLAVDERGSDTGYLGPNDLAPAVLAMEPRMVSYVRSATEATTDWAISGSGATIVLSGAPAGTLESLRRRHPEAAVISSRSLSRAEYLERTRPTGGIP